jgi:phasin family protein
MRSELLAIWFDGVGTIAAKFGAINMSTKPKAVETTGETTEIATLTFAKTVDGLKESAAAATAGLEQAQVKMKEGVSRAMKTAEQFAQFQQGNIEAMMKSGQVFAAGLQDISKHVAATTQANFEEAVAAFRQLTTVKSLREAVELQTSFAKTSLEKAMAESGKLTETGLKLAEQVAAPLTARVNAAVETFSARA